MNIVNGNLVDALLEGKLDYIAHCCNCQNNFGAGIAKEIRERVPQAFHADTVDSSFWSDSTKLGTTSFGGRVFNLYGQLRYGRGKQIDYGAYSSALSYMIQEIEELHPLTEDNHKKPLVGFPYKIGSDRAGGDWEVIKEITEGMIKPSLINMVWYKLDK